MIPAQYIDPASLRDLMEYLRTEIPRALSERQPLEQKWAWYQRLYRAEPEFEVKEFPFYGAANLVIPVVATDIDTIFARLMGILFAPDNLWSCQPLNEQMVDYAPRLQEFLKWAQNNELGVYDAVADWVLELTKLGTGILKTRYRREQKRVFQFRESDQGTVQQVLDVMLRDHPEVRRVGLPDFILPATAEDIQSAPWVAERLTLTWGQLQSRVKAGIYQATDRLAAWRGGRGQGGGSLVRQEMERLDSFVPGYGDRFELWEAWLDFDISGTGEPMSLVCTLHLPSMTYLRVDFNPFFNQEKPYSSARYLRQEGRFYGIGLAEMLAHFQEEVSTMHNQRIDSATLQNGPLFKGRKGVGIRQDEPIFPGRWFLLDQMDDVQVMHMGQGANQMGQYESMSLSYARQRTGVNDYIAGASEPYIGYSTATTSVQQLQQASKRFDQTLREVRIALNETGTRVVELYQQFNQRGKEYLAMGEKDGEVVHQVLQFPLELIRYGVGIEVTATSAAVNKEVEIRTNTIMLQMIQQFYQQLMQSLAVAFNPQVPTEIRVASLQMANGGSILMRRILDSYGAQDVDRLLPQLAEILNAGQQQLNSFAPAQPGGIPGAAGPPAVAGMGAALPGFGGAPQLPPGPAPGF